MVRTAAGALREIAALHEKVELLRKEVSGLRAVQEIPLIDQNGNTVGRAIRTFDELHREEVHMDADGEVWTRRTAWAWMMRCKAVRGLELERDRLCHLVEALMPQVENADSAWDAKCGEVDRLTRHFTAISEALDLNDLPAARLIAHAALQTGRA